MKAKELIDMPINELQEKLELEEERYLKMKLNHAVSAIENPMTIRQKRRDIARIKTELHKRALVAKKQQQQ
jgi:large subunit ribosomal protein L29